MANVTKFENFKALINTQDMVRRMTAACGGKENALHFMASMLDLYEGDNYLQNCDPQKVLMECLKAAALKLPLVKSLGYAYVVPYKSTPTFTIGYKGYVQLTLRSGQYRVLHAGEIYEGETISHDRLSGKLSIGGTKVSDKAIGYFAYFQLINGFEKTLYMTVEEITQHAQKYSKAYSEGPWQTNFDEMAKKTVLRKILKYGPMSIEMQQAESMELQSTESAVQAQIAQNANRELLDLDENTVVCVDGQTGEVLSSAAPAPQAQPDF